MSVWVGAAEAFGAVVALLALALLLLAARRRWLARLGAFECSLRLRTSTPGAGWALGVARYNAGSLEWYRFFSLSTRPRESFPREHVRVLDTRDPDPVEAVALAAGQRVVHVEVGSDTERDLAMTQDSLTGLLAWLEAAPPGLTTH